MREDIHSLYPHSLSTENGTQSFQLLASATRNSTYTSRGGRLTRTTRLLVGSGDSKDRADLIGEMEY